MPDLTTEQQTGLEVAREMIRVGIPIFAAARNHGQGSEFHFPRAWQETRPNESVLDQWKPGMALCAVTGVVADVLDTDPRNGGDASRAQLVAAGMWPRVYGTVITPSGGSHEYVVRTRVAKAVLAPGVDLQAGADDGSGRGFVYLPPTERIAKGGERDGLMTAYGWVEGPDLAWLADWIDGDGTGEHVQFLVNNARAKRTSPQGAREGAAVDSDDPFDTAWSGWDPASADRVISSQLSAVEGARDGTVNNALGGAARLIGRFVAGGYLTSDDAAERLLGALVRGGVHSDTWNVQNGRSWTARTVISAGLANGEGEPWEVIAQNVPIHAGAASIDGPRSGSDSVGQSRTAADGSVPPLCVTSPADMTYWLQSALGSGSLSGFFLWRSQVAHTPRMDEAGYVPPRHATDDNGLVQIQPVTPGGLTAKIQYAHRCYKVVKDKESKQEREVPALFPFEAAKRAIDAPEAMSMLRLLAGITNTPMVRADGSLLTEPGYDAASGYLFLPGPGVNVRPVPEFPSQEDVSSAVDVIEEMVCGFPWVGQDDRANYFGLLLTPMLRLVAPPSYKGFFIGAHQPGSGKTLLADVVRIIHGGVLRSEMPDDEAEIRKMTTAALSTTSATVIHVDNVTGVLRSSVMAGLLTADGEIQERELGKSSNLTFTNDRVWVFTGNNPSLGGDMVRRTITIMIDPNTPDPEKRTFAIPDLKGWAAENRNRILWALLVMVRYWVTQGMVPAPRKQSDSFARWEAVVEGILASSGVPGAFDADSGRRAATGGDDDGLAHLLEHIWEGHEGKPFTVAELLRAEPDEFRADAREWLPPHVLDKLARSEAGGRVSLGRWLANREGRWVSGQDGHAYVVRTAGKLRHMVMFRMERTP